MKRNGFGVRTGGLAAAVLLGSVAGFKPAAADLPKGLVLYLNFDKADAAGVVADQSGQNHNGRAAGVRWTATGKQGGAYEFSPFNSFIQVVNTPGLNVKQATFAVWFKTSRTDPVWRRILDKRSDQGYALCIANGRLCIGVNGRYWCQSDKVVADGAWHHGAATFDGTSLKLYVDGQLQKQTVALSGEIAANDNALTIGMNGSNPTMQERGQSFDGAIDEVMIFNRALSAEEVKTLGAPAAAATAARPPGKTFTRDQVARRLRELKDLLDKGLITQDFYERKVEECKPTE